MDSYRRVIDDQFVSIFLGYVMHTFSRSAKQTLGLLAVDNIHLSSQGLNLFAAVDRGEMTIDDAKSSN